MNQIPSKEIERTTGLTRQTLQEYVKAGWIAKPEFKSSGRYGASLRWPETTVEQISMIKSLKKAGHKNEEINQILKGK